MENKLVGEELTPNLDQISENDIAAAVGGEEAPKEENSKDLELSIMSLSREEIVERMEAIYKTDKSLEKKSEVALLKLYYREKTAQYRKELLEEKKAKETEEEAQETPSTDVLDEKFGEINRKIKDIYAKEKEAREKLMAENLKKKNAILEDLKQLIDSDKPLNQIYEEFNSLTQTWKEIKPVDREVINTLWQNYHFLVEKFFDKVKMNRELIALDQKKNLEEKIQLCERAEEMLKEPAKASTFQQLHQLHMRWKEIGRVSIEMKDEIWERFKAASDKIGENRRAYLEEVAQKQAQNLLAKTELCEKLEDILKNPAKDAKTWMEHSKQVDEFMNLWKGIGRVGEKDNEAIWERFRLAVDNFYKNKREFFKNLKDSQLQNYNLKLDLCVQAENIAKERNDFRKATEDIKLLQTKWKEIGSVPHAQSEELWQRFRAACNEFFDKKTASFGQQKEREKISIDGKKALIEEVKQLDCATRAELVDKVKDIQRRWSEFSGVGKIEREKLYAEFRAVIDAKFSEPKFVSSSSSFLANLEGRDLDSSDKRQIFKRIDSLKAELVTLENNIGFLSKSRNADILKAEIDRKIQKNKQEIALLTAKLEMIGKNNEN